MDNEWIVTYMDGDAKTTERLYAGGWQIGPNGDLAFLDKPYSDRPLFLRAFAAGTWLTVSFYA